ncbi:hypothetical protein [Lyngbya confervoides]|uniref:Uncharacterized protein n=1 Tax=Lyngbya confervoides BDU141951 TaxID=1574623 RepID=A0ABD4SYR0_9CYAN|nr:hypothetical protein [Lyngbya confervoides]MCM1981442.1 hypothetical protein [Lyngbya confervoides BDU141951]
MGDESLTKGKEPVEMLKSGQLLSIGGGNNAGLIIQKPFFAEFVSHGAAIGGLFDLQCVTVYTLGEVQITVPADKTERQAAFQQRIADIEAMQHLCQADSPLERGVAILQHLCDQFDPYQVESVPNDVLAKLVGVLPSTIASAWTYIQSQSQEPLESCIAQQTVPAA